jgi:hypothetical protein
MTPSYRFGKGPIVVALEAALSKRQTFDQLYDDLEKALKQIAEAADGEPDFVSSFKQDLGAEERKHLQQDVFGEAATDPVALAQGQERRRVYYEGLKRAMKLARILGTDEAPAPIEIFWGCGQRVNECGISWDKTGGAGITLFVLSKVPATGDQRAPGVVVPSFPPADPEEKGLYVVRPAQATGVEVNEARPDIGV